MTKYRSHAALFMLLLIIWNTAEFALQPVKRPLPVEAGILFFTVAILIFMYNIRSNLRWPVIGAFVACFLHFLFGVFGSYDSPTDQGFGKIGPGLAALLLAFATYFSYRALKTIE